MSNAGKRVLVVEDESMIRLLLEGMLEELGYAMCAEAGRLDEAVKIAQDGDFDLAILDVNLNGEPITPVADTLAKRGVPFVFASGYGRRGIPDAYGHVPLLQKPFQADALEHVLATVVTKAD